MLGDRRLWYGADYNPDQWPREVWDDDVRLMGRAGVSLVSIAIFSWARLQPGPDAWDFGWLDDVMDLLHAHGVAVDLATATASPPPWLTTAHPEILPVTHDGATVWPGARQHWRPTSPVFREHALVLVEAMARRYAEHPALVAWHVSNELGCHNAYDYSEDAARAFRDWLQERYGDLSALNEAWGTAFWSQRYGDWREILPPRLTATHPNPTQQLDFKRFSSDALREHLDAEAAVLRRLSPGVPITTNFMVMPHVDALDYASWASHVDVVSNDHYVHHGPRRLDELSFSANLTSGLAGGRPWWLMEHSTSAVNWQPVNLPKAPGELARDSLTHVAHGADAVCFFQWRQSRAGAEKYHSAMLPHAGVDTAVFRDVCALGARLTELSAVAGSRRQPARVAIVFDWDSWWASQLDSHPTSLLRYRDEALDWYTALLDLGVRADVVPVAAPFTGYDVVVAPVLHVVTAALQQRLAAFVAGGGALLTTYFSGVVDEHDHFWPGGFAGALGELLGIGIEELGPLPEGEHVELDNGTTGTLWTDRITVRDEAVEVLAHYATGTPAGRPAVTRLAHGGGSATYVSTRLGPAGIARVLTRVLADAGVESELPSSVRGAVELTVRTDGEADHLFLVNRTSSPVEVALEGLDAGTGSVTVDSPGVAVVRRAHPR